MEVPTGRCVLSTYKDDILGTLAIMTKRAALRCTASILVMLDFVDGSHTVDAYSSCGLTRDL